MLEKSVNIISSRMQIYNMVFTEYESIFYEARARPERKKTRRISGAFFEKSILTEEADQLAV